MIFSFRVSLRKDNQKLRILFDAMLLAMQNSLAPYILLFRTPWSPLRGRADRFFCSGSGAVAVPGTSIDLAARSLAHPRSR